VTVKFPAIAPDLSGASINLCQLDQSVIEPYIELISDPEVAYWTGTTEKFSRNQLMDWLGSRASAAHRLDWGIFLGESGEFAGEIVLNEFNESETSMNLRIALLPRECSKGVGTQAVKLVCDYAFSALSLRRISLDVMRENQRAIRAYQKVGFTKYSELQESGTVFDLMELFPAS
jgi:diamine N-acetyltransferase